MWTELYAWIEKFSGCSYNFDMDFGQIPKELIFAHPIEWRIRIINIIERLGEVMNVIDDFADDIPDYLPDASNMKKLITANAVEHMMFLINYAKMTLLLDDTDIEDYDDLINQISYLTELIQFISETDEEQLQRKFVELDENNGNYFTNVFDIYSQDLINMKSTVDDIRELYETLHDEEENA